jgi:hypothetical protein
VKVLNTDYGWKKSELEKLLDSSPTFEGFVDGFFTRPLQLNRKSVWIEKTPSNSYCFDLFLNQFSSSAVILTVRDPYDTVASLVKRGFSPMYAAGLWVYNTSRGLTCRGRKEFMKVKYEDFVRNPDRATNDIIHFLHLKTSKDIVQPTVNKDVIGIQSWNVNPNQEISSKSIGSFDSLPSETKNKIIASLALFKISDAHMMKYKLDFEHCSDLCKYLGYNFKEVSPSILTKTKSSLFLVKDWAKRSLMHSSSGLSNYPGSIFKASHYFF